MADERKIYKEAELVLKKLEQEEDFTTSAKMNSTRNQAIQMLITYNIIKKNGNKIYKGPAYQEVRLAGVKNYIRGFDGEFKTSIPQILGDLLLKNPIIIGVIIVLLSAWLTMKFMK